MSTQFKNTHQEQPAPSLSHRRTQTGTHAGTKKNNVRITNNILVEGILPSYLTRDSYHVMHSVRGDTARHVPRVTTSEYSEESRNIVADSDLKHVGEFSNGLPSTIYTFERGCGRWRPKLPLTRPPLLQRLFSFYRLPKRVIYHHASQLLPRQRTKKKENNNKKEQARGDLVCS